MSFLDRVRELYAKSNGREKNFITPILQMMPISLLYGQNYKIFREKITISYKDANYVKNFQQVAFQSIIKASFYHSPFYRENIKNVFGGKFIPEGITLDNLQDLPVITKDQIRDRLDDLLVVDKSLVDLVSTSGTSGKPFQFYLDKGRGAIEWAFVNSIWGRIGYNQASRRAVLRGVFIPNVDKKPWYYDPVLKELRLSPFHLYSNVLDLYLNLLIEYQINYIQGYPSAISILAGHALRTKWRSPSTLVGILPISETLYPSQRELFIKAFGSVAIMPFYGMSEKVAIAGELPGNPRVYEFEPLYGYTELIDENDEPIREIGKQGRIISTGFICRGMPLIRYDTGDKGTLVQYPSFQNKYRLRVSHINSRWNQEFLVTDRNSLVSIAAINIHSSAYSSIREFQFYQDTPGKAIIKVITIGERNSKLREEFLEEIQRKIGSGIKFELMYVDTMQESVRGKRKMIDQRINLSELNN